MKLSAPKAISTKATLLAASALFSGAVSASASLLQCSIRHPNGHAEYAAVHVSGTEVVGIHWTYKRADGSKCVMDVANAQWIAEDRLRLASGCELLFWHQGARITVAPITESCARSCTSRRSLEGLLPIAFNLHTRGCADN